jgi:D-aminoacyl-tRNA deacylase
MRAVIQRVSEASVTVGQTVVGSIERGFLVLVGVADTDEEKDASWIAEKAAGLRVFEDSEEK